MRVGSPSQWMLSTLLRYDAQEKTGQGLSSSIGLLVGKLFTYYRLGILTEGKLEAAPKLGGHINISLIKAANNGSSEEQHLSFSNDINRAERHPHTEQTRYKILLIDACAAMSNMMMVMLVCTSLRCHCRRRRGEHFVLDRISSPWMHEYSSYLILIFFCL